MLSPSAAEKQRSVGQVQEAYSVRIDSPDSTGTGEILLKGPGMFDAYLSPFTLREQVCRDGSFVTGDLGYIDPDGFLFIVGRSKNVIIFLGMKIFPYEVENILLEHPLVKEAYVHGVPMPQWGEVPVAEIVLNENGSAFSLFMPGGALGGDVVKAAIVAVESDEKKRMEGITTVALDRLIGMSALFIIVLLISAAGYHKIMQVSFSVRTGIFSLLAGCFVTILFVASFFYHDYLLKFPLYAALINKADHFFKGKIKRIIGAIVLYRKQQLVLLKAFLISLFLVHPFLLSTMYVLVWGVSGGQPDLFSTYLAIALGNSAAVIPAAPGGAGHKRQGRADHSSYIRGK